jgi:prepilin-type N-terminal cleavage/methylation domain-containing protein
LKRGFTLIEVVFALAILLIGMSVILGLLTFGAAIGRTAVLRASAAASVEAVIADLEETFFPLQPDGTAGEPVPIVARALPGEDEIVYSATPLRNPDLPVEYRVDIEMSWKSAGVRRKKTFHTILLREVPFGEKLRRELVLKDAFEGQTVPGLK